MQENQYSKDQGLSAFFSRVYGYMTLGVGITAIIAYLLGTVYQRQWIGFIQSHTILFYVILFIPFLLVWGISRDTYRNPGRGMILFLVLSALYGFQFSLIVLFYSAANIAVAFVTSAVVFAGMSFYGRVTKNNLTRWGQIAFVGLIGVIIASLINFFLHSSVVSYILSYAILIIFIVMTASDNQNLERNYYRYGATGQVPVAGLAVQGALSLYLDFINIFIAILEIFGYGGNNRN